MGFKSVRVIAVGVLLTAAIAVGAATPAKQAPIPPIPTNLRGALPPLDPPSSPPGGAVKKLGGTRGPSQLPSSSRTEPAGQAAAPASAGLSLKTSRHVSGCKVLAPLRPLQAPATGGSFTVEYQGEPGCLAAASPDVDWAHATLRSISRSVVIVIDKNSGPTVRTGFVYLVTAQASLEIALEQAGALASPAVASAGQVLSSKPPQTSSVLEVAPAGPLQAPSLPAQESGPGTQLSEAAPEPRIAQLPLLVPGSAAGEAVPEHRMDADRERTAVPKSHVFQDGPPWEPALAADVPTPGDSPEQSAPLEQPVFMDGPPWEPATAPSLSDSSGTASAGVTSPGASEGTTSPAAIPPVSRLSWSEALKGVLDKVHSLTGPSPEAAPKPPQPPAGPVQAPGAAERPATADPRLLRAAEFPDYDELIEDSPKAPTPPGAL